jgi:hypothetical protein
LTVCVLLFLTCLCTPWYNNRFYCSFVYQLWC